MELWRLQIDTERKFNRLYDDNDYEGVDLLLTTATVPVFLEKTYRTRTYLTWAIALQRNQMVDVLIKHGADINHWALAEHRYETPLGFAIEYKNDEAAFKLLNAGARVTGIQPNTDSILEHAYYEKRRNVVTELIKYYDVDANEPGLHKTVGENATYTASLLSISILVNKYSLVRLIIKHSNNLNNLNGFSCRFDFATPVEMLAGISNIWSVKGLTELVLAWDPIIRKRPQHGPGFVYDDCKKHTTVVAAALQDQQFIYSMLLAIDANRQVSVWNRG